MAAKVSARSAEEQFFIWCEAVRYNPDVIVGIAETGEPMFMLRMRPWKQDKRFPVMHTGWGWTLIEALRNVVNAYQNDEEKPLDYAYRPWAIAPAAIPAPLFDP